MQPIPYRQHAPSGIKTYTDEADWRAQHPAGDIPILPGKMRRCWSDPTKIGAGSYFDELVPGMGGASNASSGYIIPAYQFNGIPLRVASLNSQVFHNSYGPTAAHNTAIALMKQYAWVYERLGMPVQFKYVEIDIADVVEANFTTIEVNPNYPIDLKSDHIYFMMGNDLVALPHGEFIKRFAVRTTDDRSKREAVARLAADMSISDTSFVQLALLALQRKPETVTI